jgi:hypothetical protein
MMRDLVKISKNRWSYLISDAVYLYFNSKIRKFYWYENVSYSDGSCLKSHVFEKNAAENSERNRINLSKIYKYVTSTNLLILVQFSWHNKEAHAEF